MSVPLLGGISLSMVQRIEHSLDGGFADTPVAGLAGDLQQRTNRRSHRVFLQGILAGDAATDELKKLQDAAAAGAELDFSSDITSALDLQKVVITAMRSSERAGEPNRFDYVIQLAESPPLPPPAQLSAFGGLDDFGLGDLGFDTDMLGDLADMAGDIAGAVDAAMSAIDTLSALAGGALSAGGILEPMQNATGKLASIAPNLQQAMSGLAGAFSKGPDA
ncbi:MAG TPA: hypothetical protein VNI54_01555 [Thermoanaerobaculia bacterium]|nr:hypothetical protein [Thermoanaerobaculia bacterium]